MTKYEEAVLSSWLEDAEIEGKTSQEIADLLKDIYPMSIVAITEYMIDNGYKLKASEEILGWTKDEKKPPKT